MSITTDVYARLADKVYEDVPEREEFLIGDQLFEVLAVRDDNANSGYYGAIYYNEALNDIVVAHRGTEGGASWDIKIRDFIADAQMATQEINQQKHFAYSLMQQALDLATTLGARVTVTGHSLGGALAQLSAVDYSVSGETFNAYGAAELAAPGATASIVNHVRATDVVSTVGLHLGKVKVYATQEDIQLVIRTLHGDVTQVLDMYDPGRTHAASFFDGSIPLAEAQARYERYALWFTADRATVRALALGVEVGVQGLIGLGDVLTPDVLDDLPTGALDALRDLLNDTYASAESRVFLGSDSVDSRPGTAGVDVLHGGFAGDLLSGQNGNDYLFGEEGDDTLRGGVGSDRLYGNLDNDYLDGGSGSDRLEGGAGNDRYDFWLSDFETMPGSTDTIVDSDGQGRIEINSVPLAVGERVSDKCWKSFDGQFLIDADLSVASQSLIIRHVATGSRIVVENWTNGMLGLQLGGAISQPVVDRQVGYGDDPDSVDVHETQGETGVDHFGLTHRLSGNAGNDGLAGGYRDDVLEGGAGDDYLSGGAGSDLISAGSGNDFISESDLSFTWATHIQVRREHPDLTYHYESIPIEQHVAELAAADPNAVAKGKAWYLAASNAQSGDATQYYQSVTVTPFAGSYDLDPSAHADAGDVIDAGDGSDIVLAGGGEDTVSGGEGNDVLAGGQGSDHIRGDSGNDVIFGDRIFGALDFHDAAEIITGDDVLLGGAGDDQIYGQGGSDNLYGGEGNDTLRGDRLNDDAGSPAAVTEAPGDDYIDGGDGDDHIVGHAGSDTLLGGNGTDAIHGDDSATPTQQHGNDTIDGGAGNDDLRGYGGHDTILGGQGADIIVGDEINLAPSAHGNDLIRAGTENDTAWGLGGNDVIFGDDGDDDLFGDADDAQLALQFHGNDALFGGNGADKLRGNGGDDSLDGGEGNDQLWGGAGNDRINGGAGDDYLDGDGQAVAADQHGKDVLDGGDGADLIYGFGNDDTLSGGSGNDILYGDDNGGVFSGNDSLFGGDGNDSLWGGSGDDRLDGGAGYDNLVGGSGNDIYIFNKGYGQDTIWYLADPTTGQDTVRLGMNSSDVVLVNAGSDLLIKVKGSDETLLLKGFLATAANAHRIEFADGQVTTRDSVLAWFALQNTDDVIDGTPGNDELRGFSGRDTLSGGDGNDLLSGGAGADRLYGGGGDDTYIYSRGSGFDLINESGFYSGGNDTIAFTGGLQPHDVSLLRVANDLYVVTDSSPHQLLIKEFYSAIGAIERMTFEDGTVWDSAQIEVRTVVTPIDTLIDTAGDDVLQVDNLGDTVATSPGGGIDTVESTIGYQLPDGIENLTLVGVLNTDLQGNALDNTLIGNAGDNALVGWGGVDIGRGGSGDDVYIDIENIVETSDGGIDTVMFWYQQPTNYVLPENVENVQVSSSNAISYTGNSSDNTFIYELVSSTDAGALNGMEGADHYILISDHLSRHVTIFVDNPGDTWGTRPRPGYSTTGAQFKIASYLNSDFHFDATVKEFDTLSTAGLRVTGDGRDNVIRANRNTATNTLTGGSGNDSYYIGTNDIVVEASNGGTDTVYLGVGAVGIYALADNVENAVISGSQVTEVIGNGADNVLTSNTITGRLAGGAGNDRLSALANCILDGGEGADHMTGGGDTQIYYVDNVGDVVVEQAGGSLADRVISSIDYVLGANVEELELLAGALTGTGNASDNTIRGNAGDNVLRGMQGSDYLYGGAGADTYVVELGDDGHDRITETDNVAGENDVLLLGAGILPSEVTVKRILSQNKLWLEFGNTRVYLNVDAMGASGVELIRFHDGTTWQVDAVAIANEPPVLGPSSNPGPFVLVKGQPFSVTLATDTFINEPGEPLTLTVEYLPSWASFDAATGIFSGTAPLDASPYNSIYVTATDTWNNSVSTYVRLHAYNLIVGTGGTDTLTGTGDPDILEGMAGHDLLNGGQAGDRMLGGAGDDTYTVDDEGDLVVEVANEGNDLVNASVSFVLGANVERLTLTGSGTINGTGNSLANTLIGNSKANTITGDAGNDTLDGKGGADTLIGGIGDDAYVVDNTGDAVIELAGEGDDTVTSSVTHVLGQHVEHLTLSGSSAINGTGNDANNILTGNSAINQLVGGAGDDFLDGKAGNDTLAGGLGDDTYVVGATGDVVTEFANEGVDTVRSSVTYTLGATLENLSLTGTTALNGTGNAVDNRLQGNGGNNNLSGLAGNDTLEGGAGTDTLAGGEGNDTYVMARGYGNDTVIENDATAGQLDVAEFLAGVSYDQLWFARPSSSNNLEISIIGTTDKLVIKDWYLGSQYRVEDIRTMDGDRMLAAANVQALVTEMAKLTKPAAGQTTLPASYRAALDPVFASTWTTAPQPSGMSMATGGNMQAMQGITGDSELGYLADDALQGSIEGLLDGFPDWERAEHPYERRFNDRSQAPDRRDSLAETHRELGLLIGALCSYPPSAATTVTAEHESRGLLDHGFGWGMSRREFQGRALDRVTHLEP